MVTSPESSHPKVAIVTGAARGIGLGIAHCLGRAGYAVGVWDRNAAAVTGAVESLRAASFVAHGETCDVSSYKAIEAAALATERALGTPTLLVNNAATRHRARLEDLSRDDWDNEVAINFSGVFYCTQV